MSEIIQINVSIFLYFAEIQKMTKIWPKNRFFRWSSDRSRSKSTVSVNPTLKRKILSPNFKDHKVLLWITLILTYVRYFVQVIFPRCHPTQKLIKQKMSEIIQINVPIVFYFAEILKMTTLGPKKRFWDLKIKTNPSGSHPLIHPLFFKIHT